MVRSHEKRGKEKARIEQRRARKNSNIENVKEDKMHDIDKPITLEDLTNPEKN